MKTDLRSIRNYFPFITRNKTNEINKPTRADIFQGIQEKLVITSFHGFECANFTLNRRECKLVRPIKAADGLPWIWRARFWDHQPQTDIALLNRGFHVAYCDVIELFGNPHCVEIWNYFYRYMRKLGLAKKVALEAMSRGSLYIYSWALANGNNVACIYADNPVLDIKSWPWNTGRGIGSKKDRRLYRDAFNFRTDRDAMQFRNNPLDRAPEIAAIGFPILHVCGEKDEFVPIEENTEPFKKLIHQYGGKMEVILKPDMGHHPHGLEDPEPIVNFILDSTIPGR